MLADGETKAKVSGFSPFCCNNRSNTNTKRGNTNTRQATHQRRRQQQGDITFVAIQILGGKREEPTKGKRRKKDQHRKKDEEASSLNWAHTTIIISAVICSCCSSGSNIESLTYSTVTVKPKRQPLKFPLHPPSPCHDFLP